MIRRYAVPVPTTHRSSRPLLALAVALGVLTDMPRRSDTRPESPPTPEPTLNADAPSPTLRAVEEGGPIPFFLAHGGAIRVEDGGAAVSRPAGIDSSLADAAHHWRDVGSLSLQAPDGGIAAFTVSANVLVHGDETRPARGTNLNAPSLVLQEVRLMFRILDGEGQLAGAHKIEFASYVPYDRVQKDLSGLRFPVSFELFCRLPQSDQEQPFRLQAAAPAAGVTVSDVQWSALVWDQATPRRGQE